MTDVVAKGPALRIRTSDGFWWDLPAIVRSDAELCEARDALLREATDGAVPDAPGESFDVAIGPDRAVRLHANDWGPHPVVVLRSHRATLRADLDGLVGPFLPAGFAAWLRAALGARVSILIAGPMGAGKTTLLRACVRELDPAREEVGVAEDTPELHLDDCPHVVSFASRPPNAEGRGERTLGTVTQGMLRASLTRVVVGEVRGPEALWMVQSSSVAAGFLGTIHGDSAGAALVRLVELAAESGRFSSLEPLSAKVAAALQVVVHLDDRPHRHVDEVVEVTGADAGRFYTTPLWRTGRTAGEDPDDTVLRRTSTPASERLAAGIGLR